MRVPLFILTGKVPKCSQQISPQKVPSPSARICDVQAQRSFECVSTAEIRGAVRGSNPRKIASSVFGNRAYCVCGALLTRNCSGETQTPHQTVPVQALRNARFVEEIAHGRS